MNNEFIAKSFSMPFFVFSFALLLAAFLLPNGSSAHQPRIVNENPTFVTFPEVSKAYYGTLGGIPAVFTLVADKTFALYVGVLVPDIADQKKDVSVVIMKDGKQIAMLDGTSFEWKNFFEPFGHDTFWQGPEYRAQGEAGNYEIRVTSSNNDSKYSLVIGETEAFDFKEGMNAITLIPKLKKDFFNESPASFILSPFGWGFIVSMFVLSFIAGFIYRFLLKKLARNTTRSAGKNIGKNDRIIRVIIGAALLLIAITTTWSPWLLFFSGFTLFEAIFSWCGFFAAIGKNTCPIN
ncbi:hypothetical protein BH10BAC5_BH10BAC5_00320 [soil metagenome]